LCGSRPTAGELVLLCVCAVDASLLTPAGGLGGCSDTSSVSSPGHGSSRIIQLRSVPQRFSRGQCRPGSTQLSGLSGVMPAARTGGCSHHMSRNGARSASGIKPRFTT